MIRLAIIGEFQYGKSTLINALCGRECAETGYGVATTSEAVEYPLPGTNIILIDTPGFNNSDEDTEQAYAGIEQADACLLMLSDRMLAGRVLGNVLSALSLPGGYHKPVIPIINDRGANNKAIARNSIAALRRHLHPILFGETMPIIHAERWNIGQNLPIHDLGIRQLQYLLGINPRSSVSPLEKICCLHKELKSCFTFSAM